MEAVFIAAMILATLTARVTLVGMRVRVGQVPPERAALGAASTIILFSLLVWGLAALDWYWPVIAFMIGSIIAGFAVTRRAWPTLFTFQPVLDIATIAAGLYLWIGHWPF